LVANINVIVEVDIKEDSVINQLHKVMLILTQ